MALILESILMVFAGISIQYGFRIALNWSKQRKENRLFCIIAFASAWWSVCFGLILIQTNDTGAYICRCLGLIGTIAYLICVVFLFTIWADVPRKTAIIFKSFACSILFLYPFISRRSAIQFNQTGFGYSYVIENDIWNVLYNLYSLIMAAIMLFMIIRMMNRRNKKRIRSLGFTMLAVLSCVSVGAILDTLFPMLGFPAIPGSTFTQFFGTVILFYSLTYLDKMGQTIEGIGYQLFHTLKIPVLIYNDNRKLILMSDEAKSSMNLEGKLGTFTQIDEIFVLDFNPIDTVEESASYQTKLRSNGRDCELEIGILKDNYGDVSGYCVIAYDISERMRFIEQLEAERTRADKANLAKTAFLANMSHEIRTPINTVLGMNEMIRRESDSKAVTGYSANIRNSGEALLSIINDILDFSKVEAGMMEIVESEYNLKLMLVSLIEMFALKSNEKGLEFRTEIDNDLPTVLYGDEIRIRQVMMNLLTNAVKYTSSGSITLIVRSVPLISGDFRIHFAVSDTGTGIREKDKETLFDSFTRFDNKRTKYIEGTGLGLSIVKKLSELMKATLNVESVYGQGSTFSFELNQGVIDATPIGDMNNREAFTFAHEEEYKETFTAPSASILVVDDNKMNREVIKGLLKKTLVRIDTADSGRMCLDMAIDKQYDIILLDHMMPGMDGIETLKLLNAIPDEYNPSKTAVMIVLTANAIYGAREMYMGNGFTDYLSKPVESARLEEVIRKYLPADKLVEKTAGTDSDMSGNAEDAHAQKGSGSDDVTVLLARYGIDCDKAIEYCGDMELYIDTAKTFVETVPETVEKLAEYRADKKVDDYRILIHAVKSNARTLGCDSLYEYALGQEMLCKDNNFAPVEADGDKPETEVKHLAEGLVKAFGLKTLAEDKQTGEAEVPKETVNRIQVLEFLEKAAAALNDFDSDEAVNALKEVYNLGPGQDICSDIDEAIGKCRVYDYDGALESVESAMKALR